MISETVFLYFLMCLIYCETVGSFPFIIVPKSLFKKSWLIHCCYSWFGNCLKSLLSNSLNTTNRRTINKDQLCGLGGMQINDIIMNEMIQNNIHSRCYFYSYNKYNIVSPWSLLPFFHVKNMRYVFMTIKLVFYE